MENKYNLVQLAEAWINKDINNEEMKKIYVDMPKFTSKEFNYSESIDPIMYSDGSNYTFLEVQAQLVGNKMTIEQFIEWRDIITSK